MVPISTGGNVLAEFTLWHRPEGATRWAAVAIGQSYSACLDQIDGEKFGGVWIVKPKGENPNVSGDR